MKESLTVSLPHVIRSELNALVKRSGRSRNEIVGEAVRRQISFERFRALREKLIPQAQARGLQTDDSVFKLVP